MPRRFIDMSDAGLDFNRKPLPEAIDADHLDELLKAARALQVTRGCTIHEALDELRRAHVARSEADAT
jgi:hypothetical protein